MNLNICPLGSTVIRFKPICLIAIKAIVFDVVFRNILLHHATEKKNKSCLMFVEVVNMQDRLPTILQHCTLACIEA